MTSNEIIKQDINTILSKDINWKRFDGKTILITGANGFLPAYMVETLLSVHEQLGVNLKIIALVRDINKAKKRFKDHLNDSALEFLQQDVCDPLLIEVKVDFIVHAASQASPKYYSIDPVGTLNANLTGTLNVLELARTNKSESLLYFSSAEVYGQPLSDNAISENDYGYLDPAVVRSCYAESKRMGETLCVSYSHQFDVNTKMIRPFHTYGPGMDLADGRVFVDFVADVLSNRNIVMTSDGSAKRAYCYITDAVDAYFKVLLEGANAEAYNIGNPDNELSVLELADLMVSLFAEKKLKVVRQEKLIEGYIPSKVNKVIPNIEKIKVLGWRPQVSAKTGFYRTVLSYS